MMPALLYNFLRDVPLAAAIWSTLVVVPMVLIAVLIARPGREQPDDDGPGEPPVPQPDPPTVNVGDLRRYAGEIAVAAARSAVTARRRREVWLAAWDDLEAAWWALAEADAAVRRLARAAAFPAPCTPHTPAEYADRERYLHRAAMAAYWRKELSVAELGDALVHRNGWDPRLHPVDQEYALRAAVRDMLWTRYRAVAEVERVAWRAAETSVVAAWSLRDEAFAAAVRVQLAGEPRQPELGRTRLATDLVREAGPATRWRTPQVRLRSAP